MENCEILGNLESVLLDNNVMTDYLIKLKETCAGFYAKLEKGVTEAISKSSDSAKQVESSSNAITRLVNQLNKIKPTLDTVKLENKKVDKQTINVMNEIEKNKTEITFLKQRKEEVFLQIVDLEQEIKKSQEDLQKKWDAIKKAIRPYKNILDIHIGREVTDNIEHITISFFVVENPTEKKFFVELINQDNTWKVKKIHPELSVENKYQFNHIVQFSKESEVSNVTSLLCELRLLFLKKYFENP